LAPSGLRSTTKRIQGNVLLMPAELPCLRPRTLKRLLKATRNGSRCLAFAGEVIPQEGLVLCADARDATRAVEALGRKGGIDVLSQALQPSHTTVTDSDELLVVRTVGDWAMAVQVLRRRKCEALTGAGVLIEDPTTVHIDPGVRIGRGTRVRGWVVIEGESRIGTNCEIGSFSHVIDSNVGAGTVLLDHCFIRSSRIGRNAQLGPFAHLRPDSVIGAQAKVGNFVELKKTVLGQGSKAPHLTYLGDTEVGKGVNVGAGTITCNYDGRLKHQTVIEDGAFIGSDVQLVAPVKVGKGAYVAAGSCIVEDVPAESLALARSRQVVKTGWARRNKKKKSR
jgi:bifunctional UDP-N-acetylglucosamine pyrophosphorylase/glucosamine-1-phosphate N-acetyltransferase